MTRIEIKPVGWVESPLTDRAAAPKQGHEGAPNAWLVFEPDLIEALHGIEVGDEILVFTWLDRGRRDVLQTHPRDDPPIRFKGSSTLARPTGPTRSGCIPSRW